MRLLKHLLYLVGYGLFGTVVALVAVYVTHLQGLPDLQPWHKVQLDNELHAADAATVRTFEDYRRLEETLFQELRDKVYDEVPAKDRQRFLRYSAGSAADPLARQPNWNRTFELASDRPRGGALLLHGLSDSPYSLRALAEQLHRRGYWVVGLRLPGHGTAPSGLVQATWRDFAAAVRIGARHVRERIGNDRPMILVGYSNGAALAVEYALSRLQGEDLPAVNALVLLSPAIGVAPAAAFAVWQGRLATLLGLEKVAWTDVLPEYDPYKYSSFPVNAGDQAYRLTRRIAGQVAKLAGPDGVRAVPPILAFQSIADDTVSTPAVVNVLFRPLAPGGHQLVLFDINRHADAQPFYRFAVQEVGEHLLSGPPLPFDLSILVNERPDSNAVIEMRRPPGASAAIQQPTGLAWPAEIFSLSHVAIPFAPDDPLYGAAPPAHPHGIYLGRLGLLGERSVLMLPPALLMRLRYNPFFAYVEQRLNEFLAGVERQFPGANSPRIASGRAIDEVSLPCELRDRGSGTRVAEGALIAGAGVGRAKADYFRRIGTAVGAQNETDTRTCDDRVAVTTEATRSVVNVYRVKGIGRATLRQPQSGWPAAVDVRLYGFPDLESFRASGFPGSLTCEVQRREGQPAQDACAFDGASVEAVQRTPRFIEVALPRAMLTPATSEIQLQWVDQWR